MKIYRTENFYKKYAFHKFHYWERKLLNKSNEKFDTELISKQKISLKKSMSLFKNNIDDVHLETSSYCNRKCAYCPVSIYGRKDKIFMPEAILNSVIQGLKKINYDRQFVLNLYNEPLASSKHFLTILQKIKKNLPRTTLCTHSNGDYIKNIDILEKLNLYGLNRLKITLHTPPSLNYSRTYMEKRLIRFAKIINFDLSKNDISKLQFQFRIGKLYVLVQCPNLLVHGDSRGGTLSFLNATKTREAPCVRPFREFFIYYDGVVNPCCSIYHGKNYNSDSVGKISGENIYSIFEVFTNNKLLEWRKNLFDWSPKTGVCATCTDYDGNKKVSLANKNNDNEIRKNIIKKIN